MVVILDGKQLSNKIKEELKNKLKQYEKKPGLAIILVGNKSDSEIYVRMKKKACEYVGINNFDFHYTEDISEHIILLKHE